MRSTIIFNGKSSDDFGLVVEYFPESVHAARRGELTPIPGRNGVIVREDGSFDSYVQTYQIWFRKTNENPRGTYANARAVADWLLNAREFQRLEDSYEPGFFRLARYSGSLNVETVLRNHGRATIQFDVQPQRYLKLGETEIGIESGVDSGDVYYGAIRIYGIPHGAVSAYMEATTGVLAVGTFRDANNAELGQFYDTPVSIPSGTVRIDCAWNNADSDTVVAFGIVGEDGGRTLIVGVNGTSPIVFNPTQFEARPLLKLVDTSEEPPILPQTLTKNMGTGIASDGSVVPTAHSYADMYTTRPVSVPDGGVAIITGISYAFYDSNGKVLKFYRATPYDARTLLKSKRVLIPSGAATVIVGGEDSGGGQYDTTEAELSLQAARPNPGASAVTINGTTISLDFSVHDTIFLDCDLHDAHYLDGSSANDKVSFSSTLDPYPTFPAFAPGENTVIVRDGDNLDFSIIPRWWAL